MDRIGRTTASQEPLPDDDNLIAPSFASILASDEDTMTKVKKLGNTSKHYIQYQMATVKPWGEFFDRSSFCSPQGANETINRLNRNISHFYSNYVLLSLVCSFYIFFINPAFTVCLMLILFSYMLIRTSAAVMAAKEGSDGRLHLGCYSFHPQQLYLILLVVGAATFYLTGGSSVVFWLLCTSIGVTALHAAMRRPPPVKDDVFASV